jgi:hypothetical protein
VEPKRTVVYCYLLAPLKKFHYFWTSGRSCFVFLKFEQLKSFGKSLEIFKWVGPHMAVAHSRPVLLRRAREAVPISLLAWQLRRPPPRPVTDTHHPTSDTSGLPLSSQHRGKASLAFILLAKQPLAPCHRLCSQRYAT